MSTKQEKWLKAKVKKPVRLRNADGVYESHEKGVTVSVREQEFKNLVRSGDLEPV